MASNDSDERAGAYTLDGRPIGDAVPESWGRQSPRVGRIGDWNSGANSPAGGDRQMVGWARWAPADSGRAARGPHPRAGGIGPATGPSSMPAASGVQNPDGPGGRAPQNARNVVEDILHQAASAGASERGSPGPRDNWGGGHTLGSDETPSQAVGQQPPADNNDEEVQRRVLIFWRDGFSIEDGELYRYDVPANQELLTAIQAGRAPASLFNIGFGQPLELVVQQRTGEDYSPPPKVLRPFAGGGNRLGSGAPSLSSSAAATPEVRSGAASPAPQSKPTTAVTLDASAPATNVQIRLGDGSRRVARVNLSHTVADLRAFIAASHPDTRSYILQTTFPSRELADSETIEGAKLANAVVVQRYT